MEFSPKESTQSSAFFMADQQGDSSSAEDTESPRSAGRRRQKVADRRSAKQRCFLHSQVLRIKEEEQQIGADFISDCYYDGFAANFDDRVAVFSKTMLPASPLSGKKMDG